MFTATADLTPWIKLEKTSRTDFEKVEVAGIETETQIPKVQTDSFSAFDPGQPAFARALSGAPWFQEIQQKIAASTIPAGYKPADPERWLSEQVAAAALSFLSKSSYEFGHAPYIYSSPSGELVAEFVERQASSTFIISQDSVAAFSVVEGKPIFKRRQLKDWSTSRLRFWRAKTSAQRSGKTHGQMGS